MRPRYIPVFSTAGMTPSLSWASSFLGHGFTQRALANSAVQMTSMEMRSMLESFAASRRTSCSRCALASAGSSWISISYLPFAAFVHCSAAATVDPPLSGRAYQFTVGVLAATATPGSTAAPRAKTVVATVTIVAARKFRMTPAFTSPDALMLCQTDTQLCTQICRRARTCTRDRR
jgi:hypothetical protein